MAAVVPSVTPPPPTVQSLSDLAANLAAYKIQRAKDALKALGTGAGNNNEQHKVKSRHNKRRKAVEVDKMPNGCTPTSWQMLSFPNCNDIHEIDLKQSLGMTRKEGVRIPADLGDGDKSGHFWSEEDKRVSKKMGFVGSGLWRQVWKVDTRNESGGEDDRSVVLKVMKLEHNVDVRNFDRHRRDALAMERLTSSKNVVSIYSFCGNTVLTEYAGITLEDLILSPVKVDNEEVPMEEGIVNNNTTHSTHSIYSTDTAEGRIQLALEVMRGLAAIHDIPDGPIMHADIQAKQFLFDPVKGVKINDFNRCRFVPRNNETGLPCKLNIPSAPGGNRSPEEYEHSYLDEKIDMYSSANILFAILTGKRAWEEASRGDVAKKVMKGFRPSINEKYRKPGTYDAALADIIDNAYEAHPDERWSAKQVIEKLERILSKGVGGKDREENKIKSSLRRR